MQMLAECEKETPEERTARRQREESERQKEEAERRETLRRRALAGLYETIGPRYRGCRLDNFEATSDAQKAVVGTLKRFIDDMANELKAGRNVVLYGPAGTGKDHLLADLMGSAIAYHQYGFLPICDSWRQYGHPHESVAWVNGLSLWAAIRSAIANDHADPDELVKHCSRVGILAISDPLPPSGELTMFQQNCLFEVLDRRYRTMLPTWVSVNVSGRDELEERMGVQNSDRLRDGAITLFCNWSSYRKPQDATK